jgi:acetolactate synthase I/II/III large subunit
MGVSQMRVADYIADYIYHNLGIDHVFTVPGGGAMFLNDALCHYEGVTAVCCHHEQAATYAASAYSRYNNVIGVCCVTTGCGGTNAITPVLGAYQDHVPLLIISGQIKTKECMRIQNALVRQLGVQEADIIEIVKPITFTTKLLQTKILSKIL